MNILGVSGSLRAQSYNTALLRACQTLAPEMSIEILSIGNLPLFNQDLESQYPLEASTLKEKILAADGILIATPEFNRAPPGALKNFLDWTSRPENEPNPWNGKPVAVLGASSGARGASFAQYDVRRIMGYFNARVLGQPEVYVGNVKDKFDPDQKLTDEKTKEVLKKFLEHFKTFSSETELPSNSRLPVR